VRWAQLGLLSALSRYHGATPRDPWRFGDEALAIFRRYARLRSRLVPYLVSYGWQASEDGVPLMRPMVLEFPDDPAAHAFDLQYCLGRELLVSPVVREDGRVITYLPRGRWTDWWSGALHEGPITLRRQVPLAELPLYVRDDSLVVLGPEREHVAQRPADPLTVEAFVTTEAAFTLRGDAGTVALRCARRGAEVVLEASATPATLVLRLHQGGAASRVTADAQALSRLDPAALEHREAGWAIDRELVVVKARARRITIA
jgi:alpha-D-xyloside xylohydrolase